MVNFRAVSDTYTLDKTALPTAAFACQPDSIFTLSYLQQTAATGIVSLSRTSVAGGAAASKSTSQSLTASGVTSFTRFNSNTDDDSAPGNLYFDSLSVVPVPSPVVLGALGLTAAAELRRRC